MFTDRSASSADDAGFAEAWNALEPARRRKLRRLVRMGRPVDDPQLAPLVGGYARFQMDRPWLRWFWVWFVPGLVIMLGIASRIHPIAIGAAIALAGQAAWAQFNLRRAAATEA